MQYQSTIPLDLPGPPAATSQPFPQALVPWVWEALCRRLHDPVREIQGGPGVRAIEVLGMSRFFVMPAARQVRFAHAIAAGQFVHSGPKDAVYLHPAHPNDWWLAYFATQWLATHGHVTAEADAFVGAVAVVRETPAFTQLRERVRRCGVERALRERIAEALALDPVVLHRASFVSPRPQEAWVHSLEYSRVWRHAESIDLLQRECPALVRPYLGAVAAGLTAPEAQPAQDLKRIFRERVGELGWRMLARSSPGHFDAALAATANANVLDAYLPLVEACVSAEALLPPAVLHRLVAPNGREPGQLRRLRCDSFGREEVQPFLLALGRRLQSVDGQAALDAFLDTEFEDVYDWFEWEWPQLDANQVRAGWPWMLRQRRRWEAREREAALQASGALSWPVPFRSIAVGEFTAVMLSDAFDLWEEGQAMRNCVRTYAGACLEGDTRVASIRDVNGRRLATAQFRLDGEAWRAVVVREFGNREAGAALWSAALAIAGRLTPNAPWLIP